VRSTGDQGAGILHSLVQANAPDEPLLNSEWVASVMFELAAGVKGGRQPGAANP
jgi:hypothetical protein